MLMKKFTSSHRHTTPIQRKTIPTRCKYCRQNVFYHENDRGSKVFFDELGKPWIRHQCVEYLRQRMWN